MQTFGVIVGCNEIAAYLVVIAVGAAKRKTKPSIRNVNRWTSRKAWMVFFTRSSRRCRRRRRLRKNQWNFQTKNKNKRKKSTKAANRTRTWPVIVVHILAPFTHTPASNQHWNWMNEPKKKTVECNTVANVGSALVVVYKSNKSTTNHESNDEPASQGLPSTYCSAQPTEIVASANASSACSSDSSDDDSRFWMWL